MSRGWQSSCTGLHVVSRAYDRRIQLPEAILVRAHAASNCKAVLSSYWRQATRIGRMPDAMKSSIGGFRSEDNNFLLKSKERGEEGNTKIGILHYNSTGYFFIPTFLPPRYQLAGKNLTWLLVRLRAARLVDRCKHFGRSAPTSCSWPWGLCPSLLRFPWKKCRRRKHCVVSEAFLRVYSFAVPQ